MTKSCEIDANIREWIDIVENHTFAVCEEQELLVKHVKWCFENEDIYTDGEQLEKYIGLAKYFPFETVFQWQKFVIGLHDCTYWRATGLPRCRICSASWDVEQVRTGRLRGNRCA